VPVGGKFRTKLGLAEATGGDEVRLGTGSRGARGCVEAYMIILLDILVFILACMFLFIIIII
jgi:hypothetical protein